MVEVGPYIPIVLTLAEARALRLMIDKTYTEATTEQRLAIFETPTNVRVLSRVRLKLERELSRHE